MTTPEGRIVAHIKKVVKAAGGEVRKCEWAGRVGAPDLFIMWRGYHIWIECKAPGEKPRLVQRKEIELMKKLGGCRVFVIDSLENADVLLRLLGFMSGSPASSPVTACHFA